MVKFRHLCVWGGGCYNNNYVNLLHSSVLPKIHSSLQIGRWSCVCSLFTILCSVASWWAPFGTHSGGSTLVQSILVISKYGAEHSGDSTLVQIQLESLRQIEKEWEGGTERELARSNNCPCWLSLWGRRWRISTVLVDPALAMPPVQRDQDGWQIFCQFTSK